MVQLAFRDELTGGDNFTAWKKKFEEQITDGNRAHYAVLFLDAGLDTISHIYGYPESEMALQIISDICVSMLADGSEAMSRFNQFYFVFFLQYTSVDSIKKRVRDIYASIAEAMKSRQKRYFLDPHTGIYRMSGLETEPLKTIQRAEIAAEFSRNHYVECTVYDEMVEKETVTGYAMEHEAIHGLMHQEFVMYLQPVIEMESGSITGAEALVRWQNPGRGLLQPGDFLDVIKRKQLTGKMNMDIFRQGCRFLKEEADKGRRMRLLFNFTVENVGDEQFPQELDGAVSQYGVDRDQIVIQLNQLVEMSRSDIFMETIKKLRGFGFHICLSGLELDRVFFEYLECGVDYIKLRHDLIRHTNKPEGKKIIQSIMNLCKDLGLKVICMGVENKEQAEYLKGIGCSYATGFYYYYPVSQDAFDRL
ncbi:GGDEF domain-containing phosphodiesterase [Eisenbergiella tayi]|uniref:EAL domain-containing protein n=1 Tax=Eisenbergiella tayi TaxID=1432052 RepID=UPI0032BFA07A